MLKDERAGYGEQIIVTLARQLEVEDGRSFSGENLRHMPRFAEVFQKEEIVYARSTHGVDNCQRWSRVLVRRAGGGKACLTPLIVGL